jgi:ribonuclease P protein subunit RPR2
MPRRHKGHERQIAKERIETLAALAAQMALAKDLEHADRYVQLARKIGMRYNVRLPRDLRARICRECLRYLLPGVTCTVRVHRRRVRVTCRYCGTVYRHPYTREQRARRRVSAPG